MSLHLKSVLTSGRILTCPVFIFGVNVCHLGNTEVTAVTCKASPEVGDKTQNPTTHHKKRKTDSQKSRRHKSKCMLRAITMASESQKVGGLLARVLPVHEGSGHPGPRPDRDARGPRQWPFHSARPGPKGPARVRGVQHQRATSLFRNRPS